MRKLLSTLAIALLCFNAQAQFLAVDEMEQQAAALQQATEANDTSAWNIRGIAGVKGSQAGFINWSAGGENAVSVNAFFNGNASFRQDRSAWDNELALEFGLIYSQENNWRKNIDRINFSSKYGYAINQHFFYSALLDFRTQFAPGFNFPNDSVVVSRFMAPGYVTASIGIDYKPFDALSIFLSPTTGRFTFVLDEELSNMGAFGVDPGRKMKAQFGAYARFTYNQNITNSLNINSRLELFTAYNETFGNAVVNWNTVINFQVSRFLSANLSTSLIYDNAMRITDEDGNSRSAGVQFKHLLGIGLTYVF